MTDTPTRYDQEMQLFDDPERLDRIERRESAMKELRAALAQRKKASPLHRTPDHVTSIAGAKAVTKRTPSQKVRLLRAYSYAGDAGFTDEQAAHKAGLLGSCYWRRCTDLRSLGFIEQPAGEPVRKGSSGVSRMISCITLKGYRYLRSLS